MRKCSCDLAHRPSLIGLLAGKRATNTLAVAGPTVNPLKPTAVLPRLWARFDVNGTLLVTGVTIRDQATAPGSAADDSQGAAARR